MKKTLVSFGALALVGMAGAGQVFAKNAACF